MQKPLVWTPKSHGDGLEEDFARMAALARRRRVLSWLAAGSALAR